MESLVLNEAHSRHPGTAKESQTWKPLRFFSLYRLILAGLLTVLLETHTAPPPLGSSDPQLFYWVTIAYLLYAVVARAAVHLHRPPFQVQVHVQMLVDIYTLTILMHASGGIGSGLGMLLVVSVAGGSLLLEGRMAGLFAALATIAVLLEQVYTQLHLNAPNPNYPQAGMLGATLFATALLGHVLARRIRESEDLAARRGVDLANMAQLTQYIIQQMETGVIVVDEKGGLRLINSAASELLGADDGPAGSVDDISPELGERLAAWRRGDAKAGTFTLRERPVDIIPRFARVGHGHSGGTLIFLEDASIAARQVRQLKLASLGRLTASIAHEVRNPLGAISHAGQLLAESPELDAGDRRLTEIIQTHSNRVNTIIENVLNLSRRDSSRAETIAVGSFLSHFLEEFHATAGNDETPLLLHLVDPELRIVADPSQLRQILTNLCQNALRHAQNAPPPAVELLAGHDSAGTPYIEVRDHGPGLSEEAREHLFEPFFTTESKGTGLGLYLSRELAEANRGRLEYLPDTTGARFRVIFMAPEENLD